MIPYLTARNFGLIPDSMTEQQYQSIQGRQLGASDRAMYGLSWDQIQKFNQAQFANDPTTGQFGDPVGPSGTMGGSDPFGGVTVTDPNVNVGNGAIPTDPFANPTTTQTTNTTSNTEGGGQHTYPALEDAWKSTKTAQGNDIGYDADKWAAHRARAAAATAGMPEHSQDRLNSGSYRSGNQNIYGDLARGKQAQPLYNMSRNELLAMNDPQRIFDNREMLTKMAQQQYGSRYNQAPVMQYLKMMGDGQIKGWTPTQATGTGAAAPEATPQTTNGGTTALNVLQNAYGTTPISGGIDPYPGGVGVTDGPPRSQTQMQNPLYQNNREYWRNRNADQMSTVNNDFGGFSQGPNGQTMVNFPNQGAYENYQSQNPYGAQGSAWFGPVDTPTQSGSAGAGFGSPGNYGNLGNAMASQKFGPANGGMNYKHGGWQNKVTKPWSQWGG